MIATKKINKRRCNVRVIFVHYSYSTFSLLISQGKDKRLKPFWVRSLSVIGILSVLAHLNNLNMSLVGIKVLGSLFKF